MRRGHALAVERLLKAENVSVWRQDGTILQGVSLELSRGDFITLIGPNGAGKSTLVKCLLGLVNPDAGSVWRQPGARIGYLPQRLSVAPTLPISAGDFIRLRKRPPRPELAAVVNEAGVTGTLDTPLRDLSAGELQRVLLARALVGNPELLVLDEPAQNLDVAGQLAFYKTIKRIYDTRRLSVLMVSHDLHMVMASTSQVVCLFRHVCCAGSPRAITRTPEFVSLFGEDVAKMMATYHHEHDHDHEAHRHA